MGNNKRPPKSFDRQRYYRSLTKHADAPRAPGTFARRAFLLTFGSAFGFSLTAMAAWPRRLADIDARRIRYVADIQETIRSSETVALVRQPGAKPEYVPPTPVSPATATSGSGSQLLASASELAEMDDAEAAFQGPALSGEQMQMARALNEVADLADGEELIASLTNPLDDAINQLMLGPDAVVGAVPENPAAPTAQSAGSSVLARLAERSKPVAPPQPIELPVKPKSKGRAPLSLASLTSPEDASKPKKAPAKTSSSNRASKPSSDARRGEAPQRANPGNGSTRTLKLFNIHTGDTVEATYMRNGRYVQSELKRLNWLMRDRRNGAVKRIDPALFDAIHETTSRIGARGRTINVLSGYRSKSSNDSLRRNSSGVAKNSYHTLGRAVDFTIPGFRISSLHKHALQTNAGGVGYYPSSNFVHMDTGPVRAWPSKYSYIAKRYQRAG